MGNVVNAVTSTAKRITGSVKKVITGNAAGQKDAANSIYENDIKASEVASQHALTSGQIAAGALLASSEKVLKADLANVGLAEVENAELLRRTEQNNAFASAENKSEVSSSGIGGATKANYLDSLDQVQQQEFDFLNNSLSSKTAIAKNEAQMKFDIAGTKIKAIKDEATAKAKMIKTTGKLQAGSNRAGAYANADTSKTGAILGTVGSVIGIAGL